MEITKIITTSSKQLAEKIIERLSMESVESNELYKSYEVIRVSEDDEKEKVVLCIHGEDKISIVETFDHVFETYQVQKMLHVGMVWISGNIDINSWDVILPNTFISPDAETPFFLDFAVGENYDFKNFGLILSGICMTGELWEDHDPEDYGADIYDRESFYILEKMQEKESLDKTVVIKTVFDPADEKISEEVAWDNGLAILDFML